MHNILLIARREYLEQIRGRAFRVSTILLPVIFLLVAGAGFFTGRQSDTNKHLAILSSDPALATELLQQLRQNKDTTYTVDIVAPASTQNRERLLGQLKQKAIDGVLIIDGTEVKTVATYYLQTDSDSATTAHLRDALNNSLIRERLIAHGIAPAEIGELLKTIPIETIQMDHTGGSVEKVGYAALNKGMIMAFLLTMTTMLYGLDTARSIIEEKSSRIFEVMLSVVKPNHLLGGKLLGVGAVGMTQIMIWIGAAALFVISALAEPLLKGNFAIHFSWSDAIFFPVFFVLGFFLYSSIFSGLAATCETAQELQMYMPLAALPVWISFGLIPLIINNPNSLLTIAVSFFPLTAPFVMMLRMGIQIPPAWQFAVSICVMALSVWGALWLSSRLYRVGVLMYGKHATLHEMVRWLRYS
jgi:ABC-2 type transport system permease protein